jgi:hypothetical protein
VKCSDFLKDNHHVYALKAARKKIALISLEAASRHSAELRLMLGASRLIADGKSYIAERPAVILRKFSEFTWDFPLYTIIDFHPVTAAIETFLFLTGPIYNWRLRRQLKLLSDGELLLGPGERKRVLIGFRGVSKRPEQLIVAFRFGDGQEHQLECNIGSE